MTRTDSKSGSSSSTPPPGRSPIRRPLDLLGSFVGRFPALILAIVLAVTAVLLVISGQGQEDGGDGVMPDMPEIEAASRIAERFAGDDREVVQLLVRRDGQDLLGTDGYATAAALDEAIRSSDAGEHLADSAEMPAVLTWMYPAQMALTESDPDALDDATVVGGYQAALAELPAEQVAFASGLLPRDADSVGADAALAFVFLETDWLAEDPLAAYDQMLAIQTSLAEAVADAPVPSGTTVDAFSGYLLVDGDAFDSELGRLFGTAFLIIVVILGFVYWVRPGLGMSRTRSGRRSAADVLLSMATIVMAIVWMSGAAVLLGPGFLELIGGQSEFTSIIPVLLIGLGVDYAIHLTARYREELGAGASVSEAIRGAVGTVGAALTLATLTTAVGFLTNIVNPLPAIRDFGVLAAVGIVASFVLMLTFVPAMRLLLDRRAERLGQLPVAALGHSSERLLPRVMARTAVLADRAPIPTLAVTLVLAGLGGYGLTQLETRFSQTDFVADGSPVLETLEVLEERFAGGYGETTEVLITGDIATPAAHNALLEVHDRLAATDDVVVNDGHATAQSVVNVLAQQVSGGAEGQPPTALTDAVRAAGLRSDLTAPADADVDALYRALVEVVPEVGGQLLATGSDGSFDEALLTIQTTAGEERAGALVEELTDALGPLHGAELTVIATSEPIMTHAVVQAIEDSQVSSLVITLLVAMLLLVVVFAYKQRKPALGVLTIIPVALVVLWTYGMMAATGIPFGPITAMIAALAIGIGLPYAIHVTHRFIEDRARFVHVGDAIRSTVRHTGGAMAGSAFTTMAGFGILTTSSLSPFRQLGAVTVYAVGFSLLAATLVLPSILVLWDRWHRRDEPAPTVAGGSEGRHVQLVEA